MITHINPPAVRRQTGCYGCAEQTIRDHLWRVVFFAPTYGAPVRLYRDGKRFYRYQPKAVRAFVAQATEAFNPIRSKPL